MSRTARRIDRHLATLALIGALALPSAPASAQSVSLMIRLRAELNVRNPEQPGAALEPLPLTEERVGAVIDGQHATTELVQVFSNQTGARLEGRYVLRPSMDARVEGFAYYIGEERIQGEILERGQANAVYTAVTQRRRDPAILEQTADGEFAFRVFPIEPGENKRIETTFSEWLPQRSGEVTYRVPLPSALAGIDITIRDPRARRVRSTSHDIDVEAIPGGVHVRGRARRDGGDELVLRWNIDETAWAPNAYVHRDDQQDGYFMLTLAAPPGFEDRVAPKDVTLVLDRSGSMTGEPISRAREAAADVIRRLAPHDRVNVIAFDDDVDPLYQVPRPVDAETRADALSYVAQLHPGGGTDIAYALAAAFSAQDVPSARPHVVIFLTDGQSEAGPALVVAQREQRDVRVFTVGLGDGVNRALLSRLAAVKRGTFTYIERAERLEADVGHLYAQISRPLLVGVSLDVEGASATRVYPRSLPDLFVDDELVISGRFRGTSEALSFVVRGTLGDRPVELRTSASAAATGPRPWVGRRWAISRVDHLMEQIQLEGETPELRGEVVSLALAYRFVTPYTAFLAIPAREVTPEAANVLDAARAQREQAVATHTDAQALARTEATAGGDAYGGASSGWDGEADYEAEAPEPAMADAGGYGQAGCASCSVGATRPLPRGAVVLLGLSLGLALLRRRRS
ncbi:MAG: VWA domain-containing protein [Sandaracinaceae bacterium]